MLKVGDTVYFKAKIEEISETGSVLCDFGEWASNFRKETVEDAISSNKFYEKGMDDAWNICKKIVMSELFDAFSGNDLMEIFGTVSMEIILGKYTASGAKRKIQEWEKERNIKVGDIVYVKNERINICVTAVDIDNSTSQGIDIHGKSHTFGLFDCKKTGKSVDMAGIFGKLGE